MSARPHMLAHLKTTRVLFQFQFRQPSPNVEHRLTESYRKKTLKRNVCAVVRHTHKLAGPTELGLTRLPNKVGHQTKRKPPECPFTEEGSKTHDGNVADFAAGKALHDPGHVEVLPFFRVMPARKAVAPMPGQTRTQRARQHKCKT